jgi:hypothetical protein
MRDSLPTWCASVLSGPPPKWAACVMCLVLWHLCESESVCVCVLRVCVCVCVCVCACVRVCVCRMHAHLALLGPVGLVQPPICDLRHACHTL